MKKIKLAITFLLLSFSCLLHAQQDKVMSQVQVMTRERDPLRSIVIMDKIISENKLDSSADAETIDMLKGNVAIAFLRKQKFTEFRKYVALMKNKFNQTSFLNMSTAILVREKINFKMAEQLAKYTLDLYFSYKDDPAAKPANFNDQDWTRFMEFSKYVYYDAYAEVLEVNGKYKVALDYQKMSFRETMDEEMLTSVERYARLMALNDKEDEAYNLLEDFAKRGKSTAAMNLQLKSIYNKKHSNEDFDTYFAALQKNVQTEIKSSLKEKLIDTIAPSFALKDLDGRVVSLSALKGKVIVLDFWATWCTPCIASFPAMQTMVAKHPDVVFLFIATQEKPLGALNRVKDFIKKGRYQFRVIMDETVKGSTSYQTAAAYRLNGIPSKAVIDKNGKLQFMNSGFSSDTELINELDAMIDMAAKKM